MLVQHLQIKSVNAHRSNNGMHSLLQQDDNIDILLIQEPWFYTVATICSDTDPEGMQQKGIPLNDKWVTHLPQHTQSDTCKVAIYTAKLLNQTIKIHYDHPLATLESMVADVMDDDQVILQLYNIYHKVPERGHGLCTLLTHDLNDLIPTAVLGDFNTHSLWWSLVGQPPSSWARDLTNWFNAQGLTCLNPHDTPTWYNPLTCNATPTTIDLALINKAAAFLGQIRDLHISDGPILLSDHASLMLTFYPITSLHLILPPAPARYNADPKLKDDWQKTFKHLMETCQPTPNDLNLNTLITNFDTHIQAACKATLKPRRNPHPKGARWWMEECTHLHTAAHSAPPGPMCKSASRALQLGVSHVK
jgi:hypothetical protein